MPQKSTLKLIRQPQKSTLKVKVTHSKSVKQKKSESVSGRKEKQTNKSLQKKRVKNPYAMLGKSKTKRDKYEDFLSKSKSTIQKQNSNTNGSLEGTAYAEFLPDTLGEDIASTGPFSLLANNVHQNLYYSDEYPKMFKAGLAEITLKKDQQGWYVSKWKGDGLAKVALYKAIKTSFTDSHIRKISERIQHKKLKFKFQMKSFEELNHRDSTSILKYNSGVASIENAHHFQHKAVGDAIIAGQLAASIYTGGVFIDLETIKRIYDFIQKMEKHNRVPLWLKEMTISKAYRYKLKRKLRLRL